MKDTEDYINIELDSSQNRLFRLDIVLTAAAFSMEIFHVMGGEGCCPVFRPQTRRAPTEHRATAKNPHV